MVREESAVALGVRERVLGGSLEGCSDANDIRAAPDDRHDIRHFRSALRESACFIEHNCLAPACRLERLATLDEAKELVVCWNSRQT